MMAEPAMSAAGGTTINLSLVSHTNVGKTTLARTLLGRDIGEVRDAAHVTDLASGHVLVQAGADTLMLWDTPGFGDTARLLDRLRMSGNPIGWLLSQVWDRWRERPLWSSQQAVKNAREQADVILYLVNAAEDPAAASYIPLEMDVLAWVGKPVVVLLNQIGPPRDDSASEADRWSGLKRDHPQVRAVLPLDAFARCWVQEGVLLDTIAPLLDEAKRPAMARLDARWLELNQQRFRASMAALAAHLAEALRDREDLGAGDWRDGLARALGAGSAEAATARRAMAALSDRLATSTRGSTDALIALHGLSGNATRTVLERLDRDFRRSEKAPEGATAIIGGLASGAVSGLAADAMAGGLTLGGGMIVGGILGALSAAGIARGVNLARGEDSNQVRWSEAAFSDLFGAALLRYLAVAHFGRGRGAWEEGELPPVWQEHVSAVVQQHSGELTALHAAASRRDPGRTEGELTALLERAGAALLARLYPQAAAAALLPGASSLADPPAGG